MPRSFPPKLRWAYLVEGVCVCISSSFRLTCLLFLLPSLVFSFTLLEEDARGLPPFRKPSTFFSLSWHLSASNSVVGPVSRFLASHQVDILSLLPRWFFHCSSEHGRGRTTTGAPLGYRLTSSAGEKRGGGGCVPFLAGEDGGVLEVEEAFSSRWLETERKGGGGLA